MIHRLAPILLVLSIAASAQAPTSPGMSTNGTDMHTAAALREAAAKLMEQARAGSGVATLTLERYPGHNTSLTVRTKGGGGEMHGQWADLFIALDGEANVVTGGTLIDRKDAAGGESRGTRVEGGTDHILHAGDVIHIAPNVPHQTLVPAGATFTYFVVKAEAK